MIDRSSLSGRRVTALRRCAFVAGLLWATIGAERLAAQTALEEIVVTATKRAEDLQNVPMSIEVMDSEILDQLQVRDFKSLQSYVPNLLIQPSPGNDAIYIRGFGSAAANYAFDQSVSVYVDGIYGGRNRQFMAPFFDIERIEVMRGPQGALLGKNTAAGALSIITASPTDKLEGKITTSYNFDRDGGDIYGHVSGPLSDAWSARLAGRYTNMGGYIENRAPGTKDSPDLDNKLVRGSVRFEPNDRIDITAKVEYADFTTEGTNAVRVSRTSRNLDDVKDAGPALYHPEVDKADGLNGSLTMNFAFGDHTLTLITGYSSFDDDKWVGGSAGNPENWLSTFHEDFDQVSQEVRFISPSAQKFEYIIGAYYDTADYEQYNGSEYVNFLGNPIFDGGIHHIFRQDSDTASVFAMGTYHFTDRLRLSASGRYTDSEKTGQFDQFVDYGIPIAPAKSLRDKVDENPFDPSVTLEVDVGKDALLYASYAKGSKAGGFVAQRAALPNTFVFSDERSENYELGLKSTWLDRRVIFNVAVFELQFDDLQVSAYDPNIAGFVTGNAAQATSKGLEASLIAQATDKLQLATSVAYLDATYDEFLGAACLSGATPPECDPVTRSQDLSGTTIPGASDWTGNVRATFEQPINDTMDLALTLVGYFRSEFITSTDEDPVYGTQHGYMKWDARAEISNADNSWGVALVGKNIGNEKTQNFAYLWPLSPPPTGINFLDETRTISLEGYIGF